MIQKRHLLALLLALALTLGLAACGSTAATTQPQEVQAPVQVSTETVPDCCG